MDDNSVMTDLERRMLHAIAIDFFRRKGRTTGLEFEWYVNSGWFGIETARRRFNPLFNVPYKKYLSSCIKSAIHSQLRSAFRTRSLENESERERADFDNTPNRYPLPIDQIIDRETIAVLQGTLLRKGLAPDAVELFTAVVFRGLTRIEAGVALGLSKKQATLRYNACLSVLQSTCERIPQI